MADTLKGYLDNPETLLPIDISVRRVGLIPAFL